MVKKAGDILTELFRERFGKDFVEISRSRGSLFSSWDRIAREVWPHEEEAFARDHVKIRELERAVLLIEADHPGWVQILQTKKTEILAVVRRHHPEIEIRDLSIKLGREPGPSPGLSPGPKDNAKNNNVK